MVSSNLERAMRPSRLSLMFRFSPCTLALEMLASPGGRAATDPGGASDLMMSMASCGDLKLAVILAVVGAIVGEFTGSNKGLGKALLLANGNLDLPLLFAAIGYLTILGVGFYMLIDDAERVSIPWHISKRRASL